MSARILGAVLALAACAAIWLAYDRIGLLQRSFWWEYRYILLLAATFLFLSLADWIVARIAALFGRKEGSSAEEVAEPGAEAQSGPEN
ncbi:MAG: hypothetical protein KDA50_07245 [Rhodobacteraceae bacterium]|nr:hypothetical protein [Paracoccaceae bacterium]